MAPPTPAAPTPAGRRHQYAGAPSHRDAVAPSPLARAANRAPASRAGAKVFEKLVDYPCEFTIKVIGFDDETFSADMVRYIAGVVDKPAADIEISKNDSNQKTEQPATLEVCSDGARARS